MSSFRVIIVGGGIGGLTLANCLQHAGIDYLLLEGREQIGLHVGAAVGVEANGARILDQLGILSNLEDFIEPYKSFYFRNVHGKLERSMDAPNLSQARNGYPAWVFDRDLLLGNLHHHLFNKEKLLLKKRVQKLEQFQDSVKVICRDGTEYTGHVVVGCDGVNSIIRKEMWRLSNLEEPGRISQEEKEFLTAEYRGLYGISTPIEGVDTGNMTIVSTKDLVCYWVCGKGGRINWCLVEKMERKRPPNVPKYSDQEAQEYARKYLDKQLVSDTADVKFGDFWERRQKYALVALEEGHLDRWSWGRIVCTGDSVHKFTPESGQGANQAIETAAALANHLEKLLRNCTEKEPDITAVRGCLASFESKRQTRSKLVVEATNLHVRIFTYRNALLKFMSRYVQPIMGDNAANMADYRRIGAERVDFLPIPPRSVSGIMMFNPTQGIGLVESLSKRALLAFPLLMVGFLGGWWTEQNLLGIIPQFVGFGRSHGFSKNSSAVVFEQIPATEVLSDVWDTDALKFVYQLELRLFIVDVAPIYLIWLMEANRRANYLKPFQLVLVFSMLAQTGHFGFWANVWFFLQYVQSPIETFAASDQRLLNMNHARALLPTLLSSYASLFLGAIFHPSGAPHETFVSLLQYFPVMVCIMHNLFARVTKDTTKQDRFNNVKADLPFLRRACLLVGIASTGTLQFIRFKSSTQERIYSILTARTLELQTLTSLPAFTAELANQEHLALYAGAALWLGLLFRDLKLAAMVERSWAWLLLCAVACTVLLGPGTTLVVAWAWREEVLASKRHWAAVTKCG